MSDTHPEAVGMLGDIFGFDLTLLTDLPEKGKLGSGQGLMTTGAILMTSHPPALLERVLFRLCPPVHSLTSNGQEGSV